MVCPNCKNKVKEGAKFCGRCGYSLIGKASEIDDTLVEGTETDEVLDEDTMTNDAVTDEIKSDKSAKIKKILLAVIAIIVIFVLVFLGFKIIQTQGREGKVINRGDTSVSGESSQEENDSLESGDTESEAADESGLDDVTESVRKEDIEYIQTIISPFRDIDYSLESATNDEIVFAVSDLTSIDYYVSETRNLVPSRQVDIADMSGSYSIGSWLIVHTDDLIEAAKSIYDYSIDFDDIIISMSGSGDFMRPYEVYEQSPEDYGIQELDVLLRAPNGRGHYSEIRIDRLLRDRDMLYADYSIITYDSEGSVDSVDTGRSAVLQHSKNKKYPYILKSVSKKQADSADDIKVDDKWINCRKAYGKDVDIVDSRYYDSPGFTFDLMWNTNYHADGYELEYRIKWWPIGLDTDPEWSEYETAETNRNLFTVTWGRYGTGLDQESVEVKIRPYIIVNGTKEYGAWTDYEEINLFNNNGTEWPEDYLYSIYD